MFKFHFHHSIAEIGKQVWQSLAGTDYPFLRYEFLHALEASGSVTRDTGWQPLHMVVYSDETAVALMPLYLKSHSYGEYVFDWAWADAYQRHGLDYYPKLLTAIPFTPCYGPRLVFNHDLNADQQQQLTQQTITAIQQLAGQYQASGWHGLFLDDEQLIKTKHPQLSSRLGTQYHWFNHNFKCFDDFVATFSSRKRKNLNKERAKIQSHNIVHRFFSGTELTDEQLDQFYQLYQITYLKRGRSGYLKPDFFRRLRDSMPEQLLICFAFDNSITVDDPVAGALYLQGKETLYGRYWGALTEYDSLHFETCYYQGIEYCITNNLQRFDPGAQGEHKIQRGFEPIETWSVHWLTHPGFRDAIQRFTIEEEQLLREDIAYLKQRLPFRKD